MRQRLITFKVVLFVGLLLFIFKGYSQELLNEKGIEVALRMVGHQVLLSSKDSTSRVLPITKENGYYRILFESDFEFKPTVLVATIKRVAMETNLASSFIVEVEQCVTKEVVYSFKMDEFAQSDIIPCASRIQPKACYSLLFTLLNTNTNMALPSVDTDSSNETKADINTSYFGGVATLVFLLAGVFFYFWKRKKATSHDPNLIPLGEYHFDKRNTELLINHQKIELTSKEADLLLLLYRTANRTVEREVILNKVWGDHGDYVGRTLDVFISKLRKKLEADSSIRIANIRGVGYKLVLKT